jgi:hypothetical protein
MSLRRAHARTSIALAFSALLLAVAESAAGQTVCPGPWALREVATAGAVDGEVTFFDIQDIEVDAEGRVFVVQRSDPSVQVFDADLRSVGTIGRSGQGPGEFAAPPVRLAFRGDTLVVTERYGAHFFAGTEEVRRARFRVRIEAESSTFIAGAPLADGSLLGFRFLNSPVERFFLTESIALRRFNEAGEILGTIAWVDQLPAVHVPDFPELTRAHPLADWTGEPWTQAVVTPDGSAVIVIRDNYKDGAGSFQLLKLGLAGDTLLHVPINYEPTRVSTADRNVLRDGVTRLVSGGLLDSRPDAVLPPTAVAARHARAADRALTFPDHHPPVRQVVAGLDGSIWLLRVTRPAPADVWEIYDEIGTLVGSVRIDSGRSGPFPWGPRLQIFQATRDEVWGVSVDQFDVPYVHHYQIDKTCR